MVDNPFRADRDVSPCANQSDRPNLTRTMAPYLYGSSCVLLLLAASYLSSLLTVAPSESEIDMANVASDDSLLARAIVVAGVSLLIVVNSSIFAFKWLRDRLM